MRILIIDDNEDDRLLYRRSLQKNTDITYEILEAEDGDEGLKRINQEALPDCILLDYSLPGRNGIEVLKSIREQCPFVPIVMLTGQGNEAIAVKAIHEGAQNYIPKSTITPESIRHIIDVAVDHCALERRIQEQRKALEIFTRALAHDLKEPIRTIKSFLDLMYKTENFSEKGKEFFNYIQKAADRMHRLIDTVYFYTRLDGSAEITREECDVAAVLEEVRENINQLIREKNAVITHDALPHVYVNRMQLMQVLQNLISNAINHGLSRPEIHVSAEKEEDHWVLQVKDNGPGIEKDYGEQIFEPFQRMNSRDEQGLGLGLAICRKIVESYGGRIWYESKPGKGTSFFFSLPGVAGNVPASGRMTENAAPQASAGNHYDGMARVMLVEDNDADVKLARIFLLERDHLQCDLIIARDGIEALEMLHDEENRGKGVDLVLLDINMPRMNGFGVLEKMREEEELRSIPVVMCTTSNDDKDMEHAKSLGAVGYMTKPAGLDKLKPALQQVTGLDLQPSNDGYRLLRTD